MDDTAILRPFKQYFSNIRTMAWRQCIAVCKGTSITIEKFLPQAGLQPGIAFYDCIFDF